MHALSIIVPVYNEERTVAEILRRLLALPLPAGHRKEVIVVNDGSTDGTRDELVPFFSQIIYREHEKNLGKGAALCTGISLATGEFVGIQDADREYAPEEILSLIKELIVHPEWSAIFGSRNLAPSRRGYGTYILGVWFLTKLVNLCFDGTLSDVYTCQKLIRRSALRALNLQSCGFEIEMEITTRLLKSGNRIGEIPIWYHPRTHGEGKKIRPIDGLRGLLTLFRIRFGR